MRREAAWSAVVSVCHELGADELRVLAGVALRMARTARLAGKVPRRAAERPRCGARCRSKRGAPCAAPVTVRWYADRAGRFTVPKLATRCRMHGGLSTGPTTPEGLRRCVEVWIDGVAEHVERGRRTGHVRRSVKPRAVAEYVVVTLEGIFAVVKGLRDKSVVPTLVGAMRAYFATLAEPRR